MPDDLPYARAGYRELTPYLAVSDAVAAHAFYREAFGAQVVALLEGPGTRVAHGALKIGESIFVVNDEMPSVGLHAPAHGGTCSLMIFCADADAMFARAVAAGATAVVPVADSFSGDRHGLLTCPFGHRWIIATRTEDIDDDEVRRRWSAMLG